MLRTADSAYTTNDLCARSSAPILLHRWRRAERIPTDFYLSDFSRSSSLLDYIVHLVEANFALLD